MELERLRILIEASTGDSATQVGRLNKILEQHAGALKLAEKAAQAAERAEKLHEAGVTQASRSILRAAREQEAATKKRLAAGNAVLAGMNRAAAAEAKATINQKALKDAIAKTTAAAQKADAVFAQVDRSLAKSAQTAAGATKGQKGIGDAFFGAMQKAFFFMSAVDRVHTALGKLFDAAEEAARTNTAKMYFEDAGKSLEHLREVSKGLISDSKLMKKANLADSMGLSGGVFDDLIRVAQAASAKTGQSFDHMFDSIVVGTARSSRLLLDNLGIIVSIDEANRRLAAEYKKDARYQHMTISQIVDAFDDEAKKIAFVEEVSRKAQPQLAELNRLGMGGASAFDKWQAAVENLKQSLLTNLLPAIEYLLGKLTSLVNGIARANANWNLRSEFGDGNIPGLGKISDKATDPNGMSRTTKTLMRNVPGGGIAAALLDEVGSDEAFAKNADKAFSQLLLDIASKAGPINPEILLAPGTKNALSFFAEQLAANDDALRDMLDNFKLANAALGKFTGLVEDARATGRPPLGKGDDKGKKLKGEEWIPESQIAKMYDPGTLTGKWADEAAKEQEKARRALEKENAARDKAVAAYKARVEKADEAHEEIKNQELLNMQKFLAALAEEFEEARKRLDEKLASVIDGVGSVAQGGGIGAAFGGLVGGAIGTAVGMPQAGAAIGDVVGQLMDTLPGMARLSQAVSDGFLKLVEVAFGPLMGVLIDLAEPLYVLLVAFGALIKSAIDPFLMVLRFLVPVLVLVIKTVAAVIIALAPLIGLAWDLVATWGILLSFLSNVVFAGLLGFDIGDGLRLFSNGIQWMTEHMIEGAVNFHNGLLSLIRKIPGMKDFGTKLQASDFEWDDGSADEPTEDNTDAVNENTRALRDLAREFHNLPSGYKGNAAIYNATGPERPWWMTNRFAGAVGAATNSGIEGGLGGAGPARRWNPYRG